MPRAVSFPVGTRRLSTASAPTAPVDSADDGCWRCAWKRPVEFIVSVSTKTATSTISAVLHLLDNDVAYSLLFIVLQRALVHVDCRLVGRDPVNNTVNPENAESAR